MPHASSYYSTGAERRPAQVSQDELSDETLCQNVHRGCTSSKHLLWRRYADFINIAMRRENKRQHLPAYELADALQNLYFAFHLAVQRFDPVHRSRGKAATFKTFLNIVIAHEFAKYCERRRNYQKHVVTVQTWQNFLAEAEETWRFSFEQVDSDECAPLQWTDLLLNEFSSERLVAALRRLKSKDRILLEAWLYYGRDKEVAAELGISPTAAKLRRERLFQRIRKNFSAK